MDDGREAVGESSAWQARSTLLRESMRMQGVATSATDVRQRDGFKWISVATPGLAPCCPSEVRVLHNDGRNLFTYEAIAARIELEQQAIDLRETLFVIEGSVDWTGADGVACRWRSGDYGHIDYATPCRLAFGAGTRLVRYRFSDFELMPDWSSTTTAPLVGPKPASREHARPHSGNIDDDHRHWMVHYQNGDIVSVPIHETADRKRATIFAKDASANGADFEDPVADMFEVIYIVQGTIEVTPEGCKPLAWSAGDYVFWPYALPQRNRYSVGLATICHFWSHRELPDFRAGEPTEVMRSDT